MPGSPDGAGPDSTAPVFPSNVDAWHGQKNVPLWNSTVQPACVHTALNALYWSALRWTTYAGWPLAGSVNEAAPPSGTWEAAPIAVPWTAAELLAAGVAEPDGVDAGSARAGPAGPVPRARRCAANADVPPRTAARAASAVANAPVRTNVRR